IRCTGSAVQPGQPEHLHLRDDHVRLLRPSHRSTRPRARLGDSQQAVVQGRRSGVVMKQRALTLRRARRQDESGAILILSVLFLIVMIVASALAIDLGQQAKDRRDDHKVADLAALDGSRVLDDMNPCVDSTTLHQWIVDAVVGSAQRNGFAYPASGHTIDVDTGNVDPATGAYTSAPACSSSAVQVTIGSVTNYQFLPGSQHQSIIAVGTQKPGPATQPQSGKFSMGSFLGSLNSSDAALLDRLLCRPIRGTGPVCSAANNSYLSLDAVSWQGLMAGSASLQALQQQLVT